MLNLMTEQKKDRLYMRSTFAEVGVYQLLPFYLSSSTSPTSLSSPGTYERNTPTSGRSSYAMLNRGVATSLPSTVVACVTRCNPAGNRPPVALANVSPCDAQSAVIVRVTSPSADPNHGRNRVNVHVAHAMRRTPNQEVGAYRTMQVARAKPCRQSNRTVSHARTLALFSLLQIK